MTDPNPDIIEQAAQAALNAGRAHLGLKPSQLSELPPPSAECWRIEARAALEDVAPLIAAQALEEAADAYQWGGWADLPQAKGDLATKRRQAEHAAAFLCDRAAKLREAG